MTDANLILAVARGIRPLQIFGAVAAARASVNRLIANGQIASQEDIARLMAADSVQTPGNVNLPI